MRINDRLDSLRIASPCPTNWAQMSGDDRVRFCDQCNLHVYNIAQMTRKEAEALIATTEGRICARLFRRADGTIITRDCPVGLRAIRRHVAKIAGAVFATIMSLVATIAGQNPPGSGKASAGQQVTITMSEINAGSISGIVIDHKGAAVSGLNVQVRLKTGVVVAASEAAADGSFQIRGLKAGAYELRFGSDDFPSSESVDIKLGEKESAHVTVVVSWTKQIETVGMVVEGPFLETPLTIVTGDAIRRRPLPR
jgi:hypothetical protein